MKGNILVIGGCGFIGKNLCRRFVRSGYKVTSFDLAAEPEKLACVEYVRGDFFDDEQMEDIIQDQDYIIHAVSTLNPGNSNEKCISGYEKDLLQSVKLCRLLVGKASKLIFLSSGGTVYGNQRYQPITEEALPIPINHYGNIKLCIENVMRTFRYQARNKMIIVRISNPYGAGQNFQKGVGFIDAVLKNVLTRGTIEIWGDGENIRDYIYIDDVCEMITALLNYEGEFDTFNISSGAGVSQNQVIRLVKKMGLEPEVVYRPGRSVDVRRIVLDNRRIKSLYKKDLITIEDGLARYYDFLKHRLSSGHETMREA